MRAVFRQRHEVVHIKCPTGKQEVVDAVTGHGADFIVRFQKSEAKTLLLLSLDALNEFLGALQMTPEFAHALVGARDFIRSLRDANSGLHEECSRRPSYQRSSFSRLFKARSPPKMMT